MVFGSVKTLISIGWNLSYDYTVPVYKSLEKNKNYEVRKYERNKFLIIKYQSVDKQVKDQNEKKEASNRIVSKVWEIMRYTQGYNERSQRMKLHMPVFVSIREIRKPVKIQTNDKEIEIKVMMTLPIEFQKLLNGVYEMDPPKSLNTDIQFEVVDEFKCYAKKFSGKGEEDDFKAEANKLREILAEKNIQVEKDKCICISHDPPFKLFCRRNEVLLIASNQ